MIEQRAMFQSQSSSLLSILQGFTRIFAGWCSSERAGVSTIKKSRSIEIYIYI